MLKLLLYTTVLIFLFSCDGTEFSRRGKARLDPTLV